MFVFDFKGRDGFILFGRFHVLHFVLWSQTGAVKVLGCLRELVILKLP